MRRFYDLDIPPENFQIIKQQLLMLSKAYKHCCILESNNYPNYPYSNFGSFIAFDAINSFQCNKDYFNNLKDFHNQFNDWLFGYFTYDIKNDIEPSLSSNNFDGIQFPSIHFFQPKFLVRFYKNRLHLGVLSKKHLDDFNALLSENISTSSLKEQLTKKNIRKRVSKEQYIEDVISMKEHIKRGDIYEVNYCQEFYVENSNLNPQKTYQQLMKLAEAPFCAFYKNQDHYLICSSPERYLKKQKQKLISQPIKGTIKRGTNIASDALFKTALSINPKEKSENVMIVDLVRNDLSKIAKKGSVNVEELFGIYTFKQVHQMISTVTAQLNNNLHFSKAIKATFPMGSMTGAPKVSAMKLIEKYEHFKRGLYSGAVGYITPKGNFDFNVIIRSILFNAKNKYVSMPVGSAITHYCDPEKEYEECMVKADALFKALVSD